MEWNNVIFLVVGIYFEWNGTMLFSWWLESILSGMEQCLFSGGWNLF
jgi:hypothetical protein